MNELNTVGIKTNSAIFDCPYCDISTGMTHPYDCPNNTNRKMVLVARVDGPSLSMDYNTYINNIKKSNALWIK